MTLKCSAVAEGIEVGDAPEVQIRLTCSSLARDCDFSRIEFSLRGCTRSGSLSLASNAVYSMVISDDRRQVSRPCVLGLNPSSVSSLSIINQRKSTRSQKFRSQTCISSPMSSIRGERILANCKLIWGEADYDLEEEADSDAAYQCLVRMDFGDEYGPPLTMTGICNTSELAWRELDRMLDTWARQKQNGQPMTKTQELEIFRGPHGRNESSVKSFIEEAEKRGFKSDAK